MDLESWRSTLGEPEDEKQDRLVYASKSKHSDGVLHIICIIETHIAQRHHSSESKHHVQRNSVRLSTASFRYSRNGDSSKEEENFMEAATSAILLLT